MSGEFPKMTLQEIYEELVHRSKAAASDGERTGDPWQGGQAEAYRTAASMLLNGYILPRAK